MGHENIEMKNSNAAIACYRKATGIKPFEHIFLLIGCSRFPPCIRDEHAWFQSLVGSSLWNLKNASVQTLLLSNGDDDRMTIKTRVCEVVCCFVVFFSDKSWVTSFCWIPCATGLCDVNGRVRSGKFCQQFSCCTAIHIKQILSVTQRMSGQGSQQQGEYLLFSCKVHVKSINIFLLSNSQQSQQG